MLERLMHARAAAVAEEMPEAEVKNRETKRKLTPVELRDSVAAAARGLISERFNQPSTDPQLKIPDLRLKVLPLPHDNEPIWSGKVVIIDQAPPLTTMNAARYVWSRVKTKLGVSRRPFRSITTEMFNNDQTLQMLSDFLKSTEVNSVLVVLEPDADTIDWQDTAIVSVTKTISPEASSPVSPDQQR